MKIREDVYIGLLLFFLILIIVFGFALYKYNDARNAAVAELEAQGYACQKNPLGMYKECLSPEYVDKFGLNFSINYNVSGGQNG